MTEHIVKRKKGRIYFALGSGVFTIFIFAPKISALMQHEMSDWTIGSYLLLLFLGWVGMIMVNAIRQLANSAPMVLINKEGITDNITHARMGLVRWEHITGCEVKQFQRSEHLVIYLHELATKPNYANGFRERVSTMVAEQLGSPLAIRMKELDANAHELKEKIDDILEPTQSHGEAASPAGDV